MIKKIIPGYSIIPLAICLVIHMFAYYGARIINLLIYGSTSGYLDLTLDIDRMIPVMPIWSYVYIGSYVFWVISYIIASRDSREHLGKIMVADIITKMLCFIIFVAVPTTAVRPMINGDGCGAWLLKMVYEADLPDNLFPSMHCATSWLSFRFLMKAKKTHILGKIVAFISATAVFVSVLFTKQHVILDVVSGVLVAEIGVQIGFRTGLFKWFERLDITDYIERKK